MKLVKLFALAALAVTVSGTAALADSHEGKGPHKGGKMFEKIDANKDGFISKDESRAFHDARFAEKDIDKDGKVSKDEMKAHHETMRAKFKEHKAKKEAGELQK